MSDNDDEYQMEYTSESDSEPDVDLENQVQNKKDRNLRKSRLLQNLISRKPLAAFESG